MREQQNKGVIVEDDGVRVRYEERGGFIFLDLDVKDWNLSSYRKLKKAVAETREKFLKEGHDLIFAMTEDKAITKFWNNIHPLEELNKFGPRNEYYIGAWLTEDE